jgi:hypothetical protein
VFAAVVEMAFRALLGELESIRIIIGTGGWLQSSPELQDRALEAPMAFSAAYRAASKLARREDEESAVALLEKLEMATSNVLRAWIGGSVQQPVEREFVERLDAVRSFAEGASAEGMSTRRRRAPERGASRVVADGELASKVVVHPTCPTDKEQGEVARRIARKVVVAVLGTTVLAIGVAMLVLPGPAVVVIPIGLAILASEFLWARKLLEGVKQRFGPGQSGDMGGPTGPSRCPGA